LSRNYPVGRQARLSKCGITHFAREPARHAFCSCNRMRSAAYKQLDVWQLSMTFVEECYKATAGFPREELYGLTSQIRRAAVSIPSNVAEGHCRRTTKVYANHVSIALGSHGEIETCIELAHRLRSFPPRRAGCSSNEPTQLVVC
jgi:four helix bundle protein